MSAYRINIPYSNPFPMFRLDGSGNKAYTTFDDKAAAAQGRHYTQVWSLSDTLSFQFSWFNAPVDATKMTTVKFYVNGSPKKTFTFNYGTTSLQGTMYTCFAKQRYAARSTSELNGVFVFSQVIGAIQDNNGNNMLSAGDCLKIGIVTSNGSVWESDGMLVTDDTDGTKLIHYTNTSDAEEMIFDTYFGMMAYGYDIRLHGYYTDTAMASEMDMFDTSNGGRIMVSSTPKWVTTMKIGQDGVGLPAYYVRLMNTIMCCDSKSISDFGDFEFNGDGFGIENYPSYTGEFYTAEIVSKANDMSQDMDASASTLRMIVSVLSETPDRAVLQVTVTSYGNGMWHLASSGASAPSRLTGNDGTTVLELYAAKADSATQVSISALDRNNNTLGTETVEIPAATRRGLNYMALMDNFCIK